MKIDISELIQCEIASVKNILKLNRDVIYITDKERWKEITKRRKPTYVDTSTGESIALSAYIFIHLNKIDDLKELKTVIFHELSHLKFPKASESRILKYEKRYLN